MKGHHTKSIFLLFLLLLTFTVSSQEEVLVNGSSPDIGARPRCHTTFDNCQDGWAAVPVYDHLQSCIVDYACVENFEFGNVAAVLPRYFITSSPTACEIELDDCLSDTINNFNDCIVNTAHSPCNLDDPASMEACQESEGSCLPAYIAAVQVCNQVHDLCSPKDVSCYDSDGGNDIYQQGRLEADTPQGGLVRVIEECINETYIDELICLESNPEFAYEHLSTRCPLAFVCNEGECVEGSSITLDAQTQEQLSHFLDAVPGLGGEEKINVFVIMKDNSQTVVAIELKDKKVSKVGSTPWKDWTLQATIQEETIRQIADAENPMARAIQALDQKEITIKGRTVGKKMKASFLKIGLRIAGLFSKS